MQLAVPFHFYYLNTYLITNNNHFLSQFPRLYMFLFSNEKPQISWQATAHSVFAIKFANMQMTVFQAIRLREETFGLSSPLALCSQCGALFLATSTSHINLTMSFNFIFQKISRTSIRNIRKVFNCFPITKFRFSCYTCI